MTLQTKVVLIPTIIGIFILLSLYYSLWFMIGLPFVLFFLGVANG